LLLSHIVLLCIQEVIKLLGDKIKALRQKKKLTQKELADDLTISQSTIGMIERNDRGASKELLIKLASYFGITVDYLLSDEKDINYTSELNNKDQKDISKALSQTLEQLQSDQSGLMFDGEPIDEETKELLRISLENSMRLAKQIAKNKFTPNKYKK